mmetsp:Transcript_38611/g.115310  ORF Transcript_38611/g.115310 Transcript_38611/m.115310 type:complete len:225 (-) Transcript_38611:110-784(-)
MKWMSRNHRLLDARRLRTHSLARWIHQPRHEIRPEHELGEVVERLEGPHALLHTLQRWLETVLLYDLNLDGQAHQHSSLLLPDLISTSSRPGFMEPPLELRLLILCDQFILQAHGVKERKLWRVGVLRNLDGDVFVGDPGASAPVLPWELDLVGQQPAVLLWAEDVGQVAVALVVLVLACDSPFAVQHRVDEIGVVSVPPQRLTVWSFLLVQHVDAGTISLTTW